MCMPSGCPSTGRVSMASLSRESLLARRTAARRFSPSRRPGFARDARGFLHGGGLRGVVSSVRNSWPPLLSLVILLTTAGATVQAADERTLAVCAAIENDSERLGCYDVLSGRRSSTLPVEEQPVVAPAAAAPEPPA